VVRGGFVDQSFVHVRADLLVGVAVSFCDVRHGSAAGPPTTRTSSSGRHA
jgi:hypothetical protein